MPEVRLSAGPVEYDDTGGDGPVVVLVHGVVMAGSQWRDVTADLRRDHRCITPTLPLGAHRTPMEPDADLTLWGIVRLLGEFLETLELTDVTLVGNDWGGPHWLVQAGMAERVGRLALVSCEAFDNLPPGLPGKVLGASAALPYGLQAAAIGLRLPLVPRLPLTFGWMAKRPVPKDLLRSWTQPFLTSAGVRRDFRKYVSTLPEPASLLPGMEALRGFDRPALVVWAAEEKVMPRDHGPRLAELLPQGRLVLVEDSYTLIPLDQPAVLARLLRELTGAGAGRPSTESPADV